MRKLFLVILITTLLLGVMMVPAHATDAIISTNVWGDIFGVLNATYESKLSLLPENMSFYSSGYYFNYFGYSGFGFGVGVNYYFGELVGMGGGVMEQGLYATGGVYYENWFNDYYRDYYGYSPFGIDLGFGYKYYLNDQWVIDGRWGFGGMMGGIYGGIGYVLK